MKTVGFIGYAVNPRTRPRNQARIRKPNRSDVTRKHPFAVFNSQPCSQTTIAFSLCVLFQVPYKLKDAEQDYDNYNQIPESPIGRDEEPHLYMVTKKYRKVGFILLLIWFSIEIKTTKFVLKQVTIKYSKLGLEDFDFKHYNRTLFAGLEPHIPNAYCNCMIQVGKIKFFNGLKVKQKNK